MRFEYPRDDSIVRPSVSASLFIVC